MVLTFFAEEFDEALLRADDELLFKLLLPAVLMPPVDWNTERNTIDCIRNLWERNEHAWIRTRTRAKWEWSEQ